MKKFLHIIISAQILVCLAIGVFGQTTITYTTPGTVTWTPPAGVTSVSLQMWGGGGAGQMGYASGGGGGFLQTTPIPVAYGTSYNINVGAGGLSNQGGASSFSLAGGSTIVSVEGGNTNGIAGGAASSGPYVLTSYHGGSGAVTADYFSSAGGGAAASSCGPGADGSQSGGAAGACGGGSGGNPNSSPGAGGNPGGGAATAFLLANAFGGDGEIVLTYSCSPGNTGKIGNAHTITYPSEMIPDRVTNIISPQLAAGITIAWQQSTDDINFVTAKTANTSPVYRFDKDNLQTTTYYRRGNNACVAAGTFGNWSDTVQIKVFNSNNGRNGEISGYVQTRNGTAISNRKVFAQSLTPLKGRSVGFLDSAFTDQQGKFSIDSIFYGDKNNGDSASVRFKVYADTTGGHQYNPANAGIKLSSLSPNYDLSGQPFKDTTEFAVTGQVTQVCSGCLNSSNKSATVTGTVDSVHIFGIGKLNSNINFEKDSTVTGYRKPPGTYGNYGLIFPETDTYTITPTFNNHKFVPKNSVVAVNGNVSGINFIDTTTHVISGFFGAGCKDVIGKAVLEFDDSLPPGHNGKARTSEFRKQVATDSTGHYSIRLPARAYKVKIISASISDPLDATTNPDLVKSFFTALPISNIYRNITNADKTLDLVYQRPPHIAISGLNADASLVKTCPAFKNYDFWPQGIRRPITFKVYQGPVSRGCLIDTGTVYLVTDVSGSLGNYNHDTIKLVKGVGIDSVVAAQPNTVINPLTNTYSKKFFASFTDQLGRGVSTDTLTPALPIIVVTGAAIDPSGKNFVTVSPQVPFLVLHDPPGNASFSSWSQNVTSQQAVSFQAQNQVSAGGFLQVKVGLDLILGLFVEEENKVWAQISDNFNTSNTTTNTKETVITNTSEKSFATDDNSNFIGPDADLIYGAALNINYRIGTEIDWDSTHCKILGPKPIMITDIKNDTTSFRYTQGHIKYELIPTLQQAVAAQTNPDSVAYFNNQIKVWQQLIANNEANLKKAPIVQNISFSNGTASSYSNTLENSTQNTYDFDMAIDNNAAIELGFEIAGNGLSGGVNVGFHMSTGGSTTTTNTTATTTSYTLHDNNSGGQASEGDYLSVNVKTDPVYGTPMFETVAGGTQCPYEPGTIALDHPVLTANVQSLKEVKKDTANFTLYLNNLSLDPTPNGFRPYILFLNASSNPGGAIVLIGGTSSPDGVTYTIPNNGGVQPVTVSVIRNTAGGVYNYDNLQFTLSDNCFPPLVQTFFSNPHQSSTISISADFASPVSDVNLVTPVNNWVANQASKNKISVSFNGYDTSKLASIAVQYNRPGTGNWVTIVTDAKTKLGNTTTTYSWNIANIADGSYNLRLMVKDKSGRIVYSQVAFGTIARTPPALYGTPQPANGIYTAGTQISYSYTENINNTSLINNNAHLQDLTAGMPVPINLRAFQNTVIIVPALNISANTGHLFRVIVDSVTDLYGNIKTTADTSYFTVASTSFSTGSDALNVTSVPNAIYEDAKGSIAVHFTRNSPANGPTVIYYNLTGNAMYAKDYMVAYTNGQTSVTGINGAQGTILIPKDSSAATMYIHPLNDTLLTPNKTLTITLSEGGGYSIGSNYSVSDTILNHNLPAPVITASKTTTLCPGDSLVLSTSSAINGSPVTFLWSTGAKTQSIKVKKSGSYSVKVTGANGFIGYSAPTNVTIGCGSATGLVAKVLKKDSAVLSWGAIACAKKYVLQHRQVGSPIWITDTLKSNIDTLKGLNANTTYQWQVASICSYPVIVMSTFTAGTNFTMPILPGAVSVTSSLNHRAAIAGDGFSASIYPNPTSDIANLEVKGIKGSYSVVIEGVQGGILWKSGKLTDSHVKLPLNNFAHGVYMVVVLDKEHTGRLKLVKQ